MKIREARDNPYYNFSSDLKFFLEGMVSTPFFHRNHGQTRADDGIQRRFDNNFEGKDNG